MRFLSVAHTDVGISKKINQDAFCLKIAKTPTSNIAFAVMCDGMGGLNNGEYASALVVNAFSNWFEKELPSIADKNLYMNSVTERWKEIVLDQGRKILEYGQSRNISLGTTLTVLLIVNDKYANIHVGDSRLYKITDSMHQLTKDQTVAAHEIEQQRMTVAEAKTDRRSNILLQCVGASKVIEPDVQIGTLSENDAFMLCSDGFRHQVSDEEMYGVLAPQLLTSEKVMKKSLVDLVELNKARNEKDNITAILIKAIH